MRSSFMGVSLLKKMLISPGNWTHRLLLALVLGASVGTGAAQTPPDRQPETNELPRFTMRQLVMRRNDALMQIPGPWLRAAAALVPDSQTIRAYRTAAARSGVEPLQEAALKTNRSQHVMGLYHRAELVEVSRRTLESIRVTIPSDSVRARFDAVFRPRGEWIVDLHDAALAAARRRIPGLEWISARPALIAVHWVAPNDSLPDESLPRALYGLAVLADNDSGAFATARSRLRDADPASASAVLALLQGYAEGKQWYATAIDFFLRESWLPGAVGTSIGHRVRAEWGTALTQFKQPAVPQVQPRWFGYPQAVPRYGVPAALVRRMVVPDNSSASAWLERRGPAALLRALNRLPPGDTSLALLRNGSETMRLTTVARQARESLNGFLEPQDAIVIDPGYMPLLALSAIVHEWQHLLFHHVQLEMRARSEPAGDALQLELPGVQPYLAEGFAEWSAERILAPLAERWPLLSLSELEKRADMVLRGTEDQHALGYALVRALAIQLPDPSKVTSLLLRHAEQPSRILAHPSIRKAWSKYRGAKNRALPGPTYGILIPEVTFTIEDGFPDVVTTRILVPAADATR
ncbi:MAG TPA: hypothetical protein VFH26_11340 [Gemmatimonadales bacterium]|nr:hypothetical protein [Gemmatimonadales bacterium]